MIMIYLGSSDRDLLRYHVLLCLWGRLWSFIYFVEEGGVVFAALTLILLLLEDRLKTGLGTVELNLTDLDACNLILLDS